MGGPCSLGIYGWRATGMTRIGCERWRYLPAYAGHRTFRMGNNTEIEPEESARRPQHLR
ncbi:unnamed protein product [Ectocarpus sp. 12 AP-2014]